MHYHQRFAPLVIEIHRLPERYPDTGVITYNNTEYEHPSPFVRKFPQFGHADEFMAEFVDRLATRWAREGIVGLIARRAAEATHGAEGRGG